MIQLLDQRRKRPLHIREIHQPAGLRIDLTLADEFDAEAVPVQTPAFVPSGYMWQPVGRFKPELANEANPVSHGSLARCQDKTRGTRLIRSLDRYVDGPRCGDVHLTASSSIS